VHHRDACPQVLIDLTTASEPLPPPLAAGTLPLPPLPAVGDFQFAIMMEANDHNLTLYVAVADADVTVFTIAINISGRNVDVTMQRVIHFGSGFQAQLPAMALSLSVFSFSNASGQLPLCVVLTYSLAPACSVVVDERCGNATSRYICAANATGASVMSSSIAGVDVAPGRAYVLAYSLAGDQTASVYGAVVLSSDDDDVGSWMHGSERLAGFGSIANEPLYLYTGDNPSVTLAPINGSNGHSLASVAFLLTYDSGFCPNSETNNKRADKGVCDIPPGACEGSSVLNYAYGSVQALQQLLLQKTPLSPCHPSIVRRSACVRFKTIAPCIPS
jgi:hypothetical protein